MRNTVPAALALGLLSSCAQAHAPAAREIVRLPATCHKATLHLTIVGDSLARGWGASNPRGTFAALLYRQIRKTYSSATLDNLGIPGATTDDIAKKEADRIATRPCSLVVLIAGANDVQKLYTPAHFRTSYTALIRKIRERLPDGALMVIGLPNISLSPLIPWILKPVESQLAKADNVAIADAARQSGAAFVPMYDLSQRNADRTNHLLSHDGIHPNDRGYFIMATAAAPAVAKLTHP